MVYNPSEKHITVNSPECLSNFNNTVGTDLDKNLITTVHEWGNYFNALSILLGSIDCINTMPGDSLNFAITVCHRSGLNGNMLTLYKYLKKNLKSRDTISFLHPMVKFWCFCSENERLFDFLDSGGIDCIPGYNLTIDNIISWFNSSLKNLKLSSYDKEFIAISSIMSPDYIENPQLKEAYCSYSSKFKGKFNPADAVMFFISRDMLMINWNIKAPHREYLKNVSIRYLHTRGISIAAVPYFLNFTLKRIVKIYPQIMKCNFAID